MSPKDVEAIHLLLLAIVVDLTAVLFAVVWIAVRA